MWEPRDPTALPTLEEKTLIDGAIHILSSQLFAARQLVHDAEELLRQRYAEVDRIEREIALRRHYVAPVRKLPAEILAEIGMILATGSDNYYWKDIWVFSWTCRTWRNALLANPKVWGARIVIPACRNEVSLVIAARDYARGSHVNLSTCMGAHLHPTIVTIILQYRPKQITSLHLSTGSHEWPSFSNVKSLPNLRRIALCGDIIQTHHEDYRPLLNALIPRKHCRPSATRTHEVFLSAIYTGTPRVFAKLKSLHLVTCDLPEREYFVHGISGSSDTLESLTLHNCQWYWSAPAVRISSPLDLPRLRSLRTSGTPQARLLRLMRCAALEFFEAGDFDDIWDDSSSNLEILPSVVPIFGLVVTRGWSHVDLMRPSLQICFERSTKLRIYGEWFLPSSIDECCEVMQHNPLAFGGTFTQMEIACHRLTSEQFSMGHLATIKAAFDSIGRDISIRAFIWDPYPLSEAPWGTSAMSLICIFIDHYPRSLGNDADASSLRADLHLKLHCMSPLYVARFIFLVLIRPPSGYAHVISHRCPYRLLLHI